MTHLITFFIFYFLFISHTNHRYPSFPSFPSPSLPMPTLIHSTERVRLLMESQQSLAHSVEAGPSFSLPCFKAEQGIPPQGIGYKEQPMHQGQILVPLLGAPQKTKLHNCYPHAEGLSWSHADFLTVQSL